MGNTATYFDIVSAPVVMVWPNLVTPKAYAPPGQAPGPLKFNAQFLMDPKHPDLPGLLQAMQAAAALKWPARNIQEARKEGTLKLSLQKGEVLIKHRTQTLAKEGKEYDGKLDYMKDKLVFNASSKNRPKIGVAGGVLDMSEVQIQANASKFYSGAECLVGLAFTAYNATQVGSADFIAVYLNNVVATGRGKPIEGLGGGKSNAERFSQYLGKISQEDPTATGLDDEIPY